jgi:predicted amidohydrolase
MSNRPSDHVNIGLVQRGMTSNHAEKPNPIPNPITTALSRAVIDRACESVQDGHVIPNSVVVSAVNRVGVEKSMTFCGDSFVCDEFGKILGRGDDKEEVIVASCDLTLAGNVEDGWRFMQNRSPDSYKRLQK